MEGETPNLCTADEKGKLPIGTQVLDRGGLTFFKPRMLPWIKAISEIWKRYFQGIILLDRVQCNNYVLDNAF